MNASNCIVHRGVWHLRRYLRVILTNRAQACHGQLSTLSPVLPTEAANLAASYDAAQCPLSGVKRTSCGHSGTSSSDPNATINLSVACSENRSRRRNQQSLLVPVVCSAQRLLTMQRFS